MTRRVRIDRRSYLSTHGRLPSGPGPWSFRVLGSPMVLTYNEDFRVALRRATLAARSAGFEGIEVVP